MKNIKKLIYTLFAISMMAFPSCSDYLDVSGELSEDLDMDKVFESAAYTKRWYANAYNVIPDYGNAGDATWSTNPWAVMSGEITHNVSQARNTMSQGFNPANAPFHRWSNLYNYIRQMQIFLDRAKSIGNPSDPSYLSETEVNRMKAETKFLMAYSYVLLFELYGPVPIVREYQKDPYERIDYPRASVDEVVHYTDSLLNVVIESGHLPNACTGLEEMVRPSKSGAMALRARLAMYAASPLFNGGFTEALSVQNTDGKNLFSAYDASKWATAKKRVKDAIDFAEEQGRQLYYRYNNGSPDHNQSIYWLFQEYNDEVIWAGSRSSYSGQWETEPMTTPRDIYNSWGSIGATQETVDAFYMNNGLAINDNGSGYKEDNFTNIQNPCNESRHNDKDIFNMYANREPRFYAAVAYQGKSWHIQPTGKPEYAIDYSKGGGADNSVMDHCRTGYMIYKLKNRTILFTGSYTRIWRRPMILFRLADLYLYYAEACNEVDPSDPDIIDYLDRVRTRAGIPTYAEMASAGTKNIVGDQSKQRQAIYQERQVELFLEGQRYFDIHRWMVCGPGEWADQSKISGMNMDGYKDKPIGSPNSYYKRTVLENRAWRKAMYLYPVPQNEIMKSKLMVQNPLWEAEQ